MPNDISLRRVFNNYMAVYDEDVDEVHFRMKYDMELLMNTGEYQVSGLCRRVTWTNNRDSELKRRIVSLWLLMSSDERSDLLENIEYARSARQRNKHKHM